MKKRMSRLIILAAMLLPFLSPGCSDSENRHLALLNQAKVIIDLGLPEEHASAGIPDRLRSLFVPDAVAQTAPATLSSVKVRVTGPDIGLIEQDFGAYEAITMNIRAGSIRRFEVIAYVAPGDPSAAAAFSGTAVANLPAGATVSVPVAMSLNETKIVVPDYSGAQIVMMDEASGAILAQKNNIDIFETDAAYLHPYDIDYDSRGRIYIANNYALSDPYNGIWRMDTIDSIVSDFTCFRIAATQTDSGIRSIAIDRKRNLLYYISSDSSMFVLFTVDLNTPIDMSEPSDPALTSGQIDLMVYNSSYGSLDAISVDEASGHVYIAYTWDDGLSSQIGYIISYNPQDSSFTTPYNIGGSYSISDIIVKGGYLYVAYHGPDNPVEIWRLLLDLDPLIAPEIMSQNSSEQEPIQFTGPHEFIAVANTKLFVIDEDETSPDSDNRIISFPDMSGSGWTVYPNNPEIFSFYADC